MSKPVLARLFALCLFALPLSGFEATIAVHRNIPPRENLAICRIRLLFRPSFRPLFALLFKPYCMAAAKRCQCPKPPRPRPPRDLPPR
jgi:hypothetical protein